jgi:predicted RND superfamily exporter protein
MFEHYFSLAYESLKRRKKLVLWLIAVLSVLASVGVFFVRYESSIDIMFPDDRGIRRSIDFLRDAKLSDKVVVSLALTDPSKREKDLFRAVDQLAARLVSPLFTKVTTGMSVQNSGNELSILKYAPQILGQQDLQRIDGRLSSDGVSEQLRGVYRSAMKLESVFTNSLVRSDPINIRQIIFEKLRALPASMGYDVLIEDGHFVSRDGRHAMIIIETPVKMTQGKESAALIAALQEHIRSLPGFVSADIISGHVHAVSNEKVVKRDITVASSLVTVSFLILFLLIFPDPRIAFVFFIPVIGVALSINTVAFFMGNLSYLVVGIGTAVAGITVDHGLHMYIALRKESTTAQIASVSRLILIDSITTIFGFGALFLSRVQGYHQLAFFAILCVVFSLLLAIFILPLLLYWKDPPVIRGSDWGERTVNAILPRKSSVVVWAVLTAVMLFFATKIQFESDIMHLDGSEPYVREAEQRFAQTWGGENSQAIFVATNRTLEGALEMNDAIYREAVKAVGEKNFTSLSMLWPSEKTRKENIGRWNRFWRDGRAEGLRQSLKEQAPRFGIRARAFAPFFDNLYTNATEAGRPDALLEQIQERFVLRNKDEYRVLSFFPDSAEFVDVLSRVSERYSDTFIVSRKAISKQVSAFTFGEMKFLVPVALLLNVVLTWFFFRNIRETIIALVPLFTGILWLAGFMVLLHIPLDVVNIISIVIVSGVIVDYGIGVTYEYQYNLKIGTVMAVSLSAITTALGSGVLLLAKHPVMFSIGVGMTVSVFTGYLTSILVVPALCNLFVRSSRREARL